MHHAHRVEQFVTGGTLEQVALRTGLKRTQDALVCIKRREHDHPRLWGRFTQPVDRLHAVHLRHFQVEEDHVGVVRAGQPHRFAAAGGLTHHLEIRLRAQHGDQPIAHNRVIVYNQNVYRFGHRFCSNGIATSSRVPSPGLLCRRRVPPSSLTRSLRPISP